MAIKGAVVTDAELEARVAAVRRFNRFYTQRIGVLRQGLLDSPFSLTESRVLYELAHRAAPTAAALARDLGLDPGYLSRILRTLQRQGLVDRRPSAEDGRQRLLSLTEKGRDAFADLDRRSHGQLVAMLGALDAGTRARLVRSMRVIETTLGGAADVPVVLRPPRPGDIGWVVQRHGALYAEEYGWDASFEVLVARIAADFLESFDPRTDCCWIAERDGDNAGSAFVVRGDAEGVAKLRLVLVEPSARGLGIGGRLVDECLGFARRAGYRRMTLWTNDILVAARRIYEKAGFALVREEPHHSFGHDLVGQFWERDL